MRHSPTTVVNSMEDLLRFAIGFEPMFARISSNPVTYPPYNLTHDENGYKLELAVAGFKMEELEINLTNDRILEVRGSKADDAVERNFVHRGIAARDFERQFTLAEHIKVIGARDQCDHTRYKNQVFHANGLAIGTHRIRCQICKYGGNFTAHNNVSLRVDIV